MVAIRIKVNTVQLFGLWTSCSMKIVTSPKEDVAVWLVEFSCGVNVTKSLKDTTAGPTWV